MDTIGGPIEARASRERRVPNFRLRCDPQKLLAAALEQFSQTSFSETRISSITRRLGLSKSALYMHFQSKRELFDQVVEGFCLTDDLDDQSTSETLQKVLGSDPAAQVLRIVLREWSSIPGIGAQYLEALTTRLAAQLRTLDSGAARQLASAALAPLTVSILFSADPPGGDEP